MTYSSITIVTFVLATIILKLILHFTGKKSGREITFFSKKSKTTSYLIMIGIAVIFIIIFIGIDFLLYGPNGLIKPHHF